MKLAKSSSRLPSCPDLADIISILYFWGGGTPTPQEFNQTLL